MAINPTSYVTDLYQNYLGRAPDADGLKYYTDMMNSGVSYQEVAAKLAANAATNTNRPDDQNAILNGVGNTGGGLGGGTPTGGGTQTPAPTVDLSGVTSAISGLGTQMGTGFTETNNNINTGFDTTNQNIGQVNTNLQTGFNSLNEANEGRAEALGQQATDNFNQLKGWTSGLGGQLTDLKSTMGTGMTGLSSQIGGVQSSVDTVGSDLTNFQNDYTRRTNIADQKRSELMDSVAGTAANTRQALTQGFNQVGNQINGLAAPQGGGQPQGVPQGGQPQGGANQFVTALNNARQAVANPQNLNPAMGAQLSEFVSAFDQNGQLIQQGPDAQGVMTFRNMGPDGLLQIAKQTQQGMQFAGAINVNQIIQMFGGQ